MSEELTHATTGSDPSFSGCIRVSDQKQTIRIIATRVMVQQAIHIGALWLAPFVDWYSWQ